MADLTIFNNKVHKREGGGKWVELSDAEGRRELMLQRHVQNLSPTERFAAAAGGYFRNTMSGARQLMGGDAMEEQDLRNLTTRQTQELRDYGGVPAQAGEFLAPVTSAFLPGGWPAQLTYAAAQGAAERPNRPALGAGIGLGAGIVGEGVAGAAERIYRTARAHRESLDPGIAEQVRKGEELGLEFTPGQREGAFSATRRMENQLLKNPKYFGLDEQRFMNNQHILHNLAAEALGETPTGYISASMRGNVTDKVSEAFDAIKDFSAPIDLGAPELRASWDEFTADLTDAGIAQFERFMKRWPSLFDGTPVSGTDFVNARNWLAKQNRATANIQSGAAEEMQGLMRIMDDGLELANINQPGALQQRIADARRVHKAKLVIEDSQMSPKYAATGTLNPDSLYRSLRRYDKGGIFRGRGRGDFEAAVDALTATRDLVPPQPPSQETRGYIKGALDLINPAPQMYMEGGAFNNTVGRLLLGQAEAIPRARDNYGRHLADYLRKGIQGSVRSAAGGIMDEDSVN